MKKAIAIIILGLLWCNVGFAASDAEYIKRCAEHKYGKKLTYNEFQEIMTPENADEGHPFVSAFDDCEDKFKKYPIMFREIFN